MKIAVSTDLFTPLVQSLLDDLKLRNHSVVYVGPKKGEDEKDWPDVTFEAARMVSNHDVDEAIVFCWTGTGASIAANKIHGIRAALCTDAETARGARTWNHANILALSLRLTSEPLLKEILDAWFSTPFSADNWNKKQVEKLGTIESGEVGISTKG